MSTSVVKNLVISLLILLFGAGCGISESTGTADGGPKGDAATECACDVTEKKCDEGCECDALCEVQTQCSSDADCTDVCPESDKHCRICVGGKCNCTASAELTACEDGQQDCATDGFYCKPIETPCDCNDDAEFCDADCDCDVLCGTKRDEEPCKADMDCETGLNCLNPDDTGEIGFCIKFCNPMSRAIQCPEGKMCIVVEEGNPTAGLCIQLCDPASPEECGADRTCYRVGEGAGGVCFSEGDKQRFEECEYTFDCADGMICPPAESAEGEENPMRVCIELCSPSGQVQCREEGYSCIAMGEDSESGVCIQMCADPVGNDCPADFTCIPNLGDPGSSTGAVCLPAGDKPESSVCTEFIGECGDGLFCMGFSEGATSGICWKLCSMSEPDGQQGCEEGQMCLGDPQSPYGFCVTPCNDPFNNTCPQGQACYWMMFDSICFPEGSKLEGEECSAPFECQPGHACSGVCAKLCNEPLGSHKCDQGDFCFNPGGGTGMCIEPCDDPVAGTGCPGATQGCYIIMPQMGPYCLWAGQGLASDECGWSPDCSPGLFCESQGRGQEGECKKVCDPGGDPACQENETCQPLPQGSAYGVCE